MIKIKRTDKYLVIWKTYYGVFNSEDAAILKCEALTKNPIHDTALIIHLKREDGDTTVESVYGYRWLLGDSYEYVHLFI